MGWRDLLQATDETFVSPWVGGRSLRRDEQTWAIEGKLPKEHGWYSFKLNGRKATFGGEAAPSEGLHFLVCGYLVGDRIVPDKIRVDPDPAKIITFSEPVHLVEPGLDRFVRIMAGRMFEDGPLIFERQEMPLGAEEEVLKAFLDQKDSVDHIPNVPPALDAAFRMEVFQRVEAQRRRQELERQLREEQERHEKEERRQKLVEALGSGEGRRLMAQADFGQAARAALAVGGAEYLDHRAAYGRNEMVVRFRLNQRRFECTCDAKTLRIIDAGICLVDHRTNEKGDTRFTLESLPGVILQAQREHKLVVFRHVDEDYGNHDDDEDDNYDD